MKEGLGIWLYFLIMLSPIILLFLYGVYDETKNSKNRTRDIREAK